MSHLRVSACLCIAILICLGASTLRAQETATSREAVWVGVQVYTPDEEGTDYLIGTIEKYVLTALEAGTYERRFVRISNLRVEDTDAQGNTVGYWDATDNFDWGIMLVDTEAILSIQFKKGDPMRIGRTAAAR